MSSLNALNQSPIPKMQHVDAKLWAQDMCPVQNICLENTPPVINVNVAVGIAAYLNATQPVIPFWCDKKFPPQPEPSQSTSIKREAREARRIAESGYKFDKESYIKKKLSRSLQQIDTKVEVDAKVTIGVKARKHLTI